jgi:hypothetical protein
LGGGVGSDCFLTAGRELVIARRIEFEADLLCAAERDVDCDLIVFPFYSSATPPLPPPPS